MQTPTIDRAPSLVELLAADTEYAKRYDQCLRDIENAATIAELKRTASTGNSNQTYIKEWNSHHGMLQRVRRSGVGLSPELRDFATFLAHVGPKPHYEAIGKLSLDKTNSKGYLIGYIRWESPEGQTRNRRNSKFHLYMGRYYNDKQLATLLSELSSATVKPDTVKQRRLRGKTTLDQFAMENVLYDSGDDPIAKWDFPPSQADRLRALYRVHHRRGENRLEFFMRWLRTVDIPRLKAIEQSDDITSEQREAAYRTYAISQVALGDAKKRLADLRRQKADEALASAIYNADDFFNYSESSVRND